MKKKVTLIDAVGKTLDGFEFSTTCGQAVLTFTDGTFVTLGIEKAYDRYDDGIEETDLELDDFGDDKLVGLGVITQLELDERREQKRKKLADAQEKREREQYERLKHKFES